MHPISRRAFLAQSALGTVALSRMARAAEPEKAPSAAVVDACNSFNASFFRVAAKQPGNVFFSPFSMEVAFAMLAAGARGETLAQLQRAFHLPPEMRIAHAGFKELLERLNDPRVPAEKRGYKLSVANALWGPTKYPWRKEYLATVGEHYGAGLLDTNFDQPEPARLKINSWVEQQTRQKIKDLLPPGSITPLTRMVLTNAIYFKGRWEIEFDKKLTRDEDFFTASGKENRVPMMHMRRRREDPKEPFSYAEDGAWKTLEMPYTGKETSMVILLPMERGGLAKRQGEIDATFINRMISRLSPYPELVVTVPRFKLETRYDLKPLLRELGVTDVFDEWKADLTGMHTSSERLLVTDAFHKAYVDVNEEGTEAAAATGIVVGVRSVPPPPKIFKADHPFVFLIRHKPTNLILFFGKVESL